MTNGESDLLRSGISDVSIVAKDGRAASEHVGKALRQGVTALNEKSFRQTTSQLNNQSVVAGPAAIVDEERATGLAGIDNEKVARKALPQRFAEKERLIAGQQVA